MPTARDAVVPLDEQHTHTDLGWCLVTATREFKRLALEAMSDLPGGSRGYLVLKVAGRGQPQSQLSLARELGIDKTVMTYLLDELEQAGLIERRPDPNDRRARHIHVTRRGRSTLATCRETVAGVESTFLNTLGAKDAAKFRELLERLALADRVKPEDECGPAAPC